MISAIIQARTRSSRFPRKIYHKIDGKTIIEYVCNRVSKSKILQSVILAMPEYDKEELINTFGGVHLRSREEIAQAKKILGVNELFFGDESNVLSRYYRAAKMYGCNLVVRVTADCPLIMPELIDEMLLYYMQNGLNGYLFNRMNFADQYPSGFDVEIFPYWALCKASISSSEPNDLEHVTPWMRRNVLSYSYANYHPHLAIPHSDKKFSLDEREELPLVEAAVRAMNSGMSIQDSLRAAVTEAGT